MYRVRVNNSTSRKSILENSKRLSQNEEFRQTYVSRDLTYLQRQERKAARDARRANLGRDGVVGSQPNVDPENRVNFL